jgi:DNA polymerase III subunit epsilon
VTPPFLEEYRACFHSTWSDEEPIDRVRFIVLDSETTGLNPATDRIITIGAVAVLGGDIVLEDSFSALLQVDRNTEAVTVHGITRDETRKGVPEVVALARFFEYLRDGVIVGHHIGHDIATIDAACERHWGARLMNRRLDTMDLTLHLERAGAFAGRPPIRHFTLDALSTMFGVIPYDRHTATGDAFITAQVFLRLVRLASRCGRGTLARITEPFDVDESPSPNAFPGAGSSPEPEAKRWFN